jgi:hypothetical protein
LLCQRDLSCFRPIWLRLLAKLTKLVIRIEKGFIDRLKATWSWLLSKGIEVRLFESVFINALCGRLQFQCTLHLRLLRATWSCLLTEGRATYAILREKGFIVALCGILS